MFHFEIRCDPAADAQFPVTDTRRIRKLALCGSISPTPGAPRPENKLPPLRLQ
jgi:hypothetical protein